MENINDIKTFDDIPQHTKDLFMDTCAGICYSQKMASENYDLSKVKEYKHKINITQIIKDELEKSNYRKLYEWNRDKEFVSCGVKIKLLKYDITTSDWCLVLMDGEKTKITKKSLREWWNGRDIK